MYIPPGRKRYDRSELRPSEDNIELGPPTLQNDQIYRQQFAIQDYLKTLKEQITLGDFTKKQGGPVEQLKPAIKNKFYIKEQR